MSQTETVAPPRSYEDIAALHGRRSLLYIQFGSYQGEWWMLATDDQGDYFIYKGWYGSCSGCDEIEGTFSYGDDTTREKVQEFADQYRPFAIIPRATIKNLVTNDTLLTVFPGNVREDGDAGQEFVREAGLIVRLEEDMPIDGEMALSSANQETRRRMIELLGIEQFITDVIHEDGPDKLANVRDGGVYLWLRDSSTEREYLLRVPPETTTVRAGKAWSFGLSEDEYAPLIET